LVFHCGGEGTYGAGGVLAWKFCWGDVRITVLRRALIRDDPPFGLLDQVRWNSLNVIWPLVSSPLRWCGT